MWLVIRDSDNAVIGTNYTHHPDNIEGYTIKEWVGLEPPIHNPDRGVFSYDPTLTDPDYANFLLRRVDFDDLHSQASTEIGWLNDNIPLVASADLATLRQFLERVMREQRQEIKAWRYIFSRFA